MPALRKYGAAATVLVPMIKAGAIDFAGSGDWTPAAGDVKVSKDDGAFANITTLPTAVGNMWKFSLSATEMQAARVVIQVVDSATKTVEDQAIAIETYGHESAQHAFDIDLAEQTVDVVKIDGSATAATGCRYAHQAVAVGSVAASGSNTATSFKVDGTLGAKGDGYFGNGSGGAVLIFIAGTANEYQARRIIAFNGTTDFVTVEESFSTTPADADGFIILGRITELA